MQISKLAPRTDPKLILQDKIQCLYAYHDLWELRMKEAEGLKDSRKAGACKKLVEYWRGKLEKLGIQV